MKPEVVIAPVAERGKRPRNRQSMIVAAAADLFAERGFSNVSMSDIAEAVKVQPSALYRHFSSKQDLLRATIAQGVAIRTAAVGPADSERSLDDTVSDLVESAMNTRSLSSLWTTEVRILEVEESRELRRQIRDLPLTLAARLRISRPELVADQATLLSWVFLDALASISFTDETPRTRATSETLEGIGKRVLATALRINGPSTAAPGGLDAEVFRTRRDDLASAAARLFRRRGFASVTLEDIGNEVGMAGASIYGHYTSKQEILDELIVRSLEWERYAVTQALRDARHDALYAIEALRGYVRFVNDAPDLAWLRLTETRHASESVAQRSMMAERDEVARWASALSPHRMGQDVAQIKVEVRAARMAALDVSTTASLRPMGVDVEAVTQVCSAVMGVEGANDASPA